jgi:hypothetical protein
MSTTSAGILHQETDTATSELHIDVPLSGVFPCSVSAGAHESTGYPNLKRPVLS